MRRLVPKGSTLLRYVAEPIPLRRLPCAMLACVIAAVIYCQIWCLVAYPSTSHLPMPIHASLAWAIGAIVPWLIGFEIGKRRAEMAWSKLAQNLLLVSALAFASLLAIVLELGLDRLIGAPNTRPLSMQLAAQIPAALLTAGALTFCGLITQLRQDKPATPSDVLDALFSNAGEIEWIEAAGNYVEVHASGRITLHRMTMRDLENSLDSARFVRIHRSVIVNTAHIDSRLIMGGSEAIRLKSAKVFKVGHRYRCNLDTAMR